jgi:hypothetical protein
MSPIKKKNTKNLHPSLLMVPKVRLVSEIVGVRAKHLSLMIVLYYLS